MIAVAIVAILTEAAVIAVLLHHIRRLTEAALVQTQPHAAAVLRAGPVTTAWARRRAKRNPQTDPTPERVQRGEGAVPIGL